MQQVRQADLWQQVWAEYDARRALPPPTSPPAMRPERRRRPRGRGLRAALAGCILAATGAYAVAPLLAAARVGEALAAGDTAWLAQAVDWQEVSPGLQHGLMLAAAGHEGQAAAFLRAIAQDVAQGMATPDGMAGLLRERLPQGGSIGSVRPLDPTRWEVGLHAPGRAEQALAVTLSLRDPLRLRWQVTGMTLRDRPPDWGG